MASNGDAMIQTAVSDQVLTEVMILRFEVFPYFVG